MKKRWTYTALSAALIAGLSLNSVMTYAEGNGTPPGNGEPPQGEPNGTPSEGAPGGGPGGSSEAVTEWTAVKEYSEDTEESDQTYDSTGTDENAIHVSGGTVVLNNPTVTRSSEDSQGGDSSSFYGTGASVLTSGGTVIVNGGSVTSTANGAAGVFAYDSGTAYVSDTTIHTSGNTAGGIHVAGGGTLYAYDLDVTTEGDSSAAIRSDRGGGTMVVDGGTYTSNGNGSPAVYVTADITINDAELTANNSEGVCIEGKNSLRLFNTDLVSNMPDQDQNDTTWSVILYQSMSGDSEVGNSSFYMEGGSLDSKNGGIFYSTNTASDFYLNNVTITKEDEDGYFLKVTGNSNARGWGETGSNGAQTIFTADNQIMDGDVIWDSISTLDLYMENGSVLKGAVIDDESNAGDGGDGYATIYIDDSSKWIVTGDSYLTNLYSEGTIEDAEGNTVTIIGSDGTVYVQGDSDYTITLSGTYGTEADFSNALTSISYDDYKVEKPSELTSSETEEEPAVEETAAEETAEPEEDVPEETVSESTQNHVTWIIAGAAVLMGSVIVLLARKKK